MHVLLCVLQFDGISDRNITSYQVDLRISNGEKLPDLWLPVQETAQIFESRFIHYIPDSPVSYVSVIGTLCFQFYCVLLFCQVFLSLRP